MSIEELRQRLDNIEGSISYYECCESGYDYDAVKDLEARRDEVIRQIQALEKGDKGMNLEVIKAEQPIIKVNFDEVKEALTARLEEYKGLQVTEETLSGCKAAQKELASLRVEVDNQRKKIKKELSAPITKFEDDCKLLIAMIETVEAPIKDGIKVFDDARREEKRQTAIKIIAEEVLNAGLNETFGKRVEIKDKYMNLTATESDVRDDVIAQTIALKVQQNAEADKIKVIVNEIERANKRLTAKMSLDMFRYDIDMGRSTSDILASINDRADTIYSLEHPETKEEVKEEPKKIEKPQMIMKHYSVTFTIKGNADEMRMVSSFLKQNGVNYTVIEQKEI